MFMIDIYTIAAIELPLGITASSIIGNLLKEIF